MKNAHGPADKALEYDAHISNLSPIMTFVVESAKGVGFVGENLFGIELAVEEIVVNVFNYAYPPGVKGRVRVECLIDGGVFSVQVADNGLPFDPLGRRAPNIEKEIEDRTIGGLGIFLARQTADEMVYVRKGDRNILTLHFQIKA